MYIRRTYIIKDGNTRWTFEVELPSRNILACARHEVGDDFHETAYYSEASPEVRLKLELKINSDIRGITKIKI